MKSHFFCCLSTWGLILAANALAAAPDPLSRLDEALKAAASYQYGKDAQPLRTAEQIVVAAVKDPQQRAAVEQRLLAALNANVTRDAREFLCRQLFFVGTTQCIPALEALLTDPAGAHMARYVLGQLEYPEALAALHRALGKTSGKLQVGLITTLGERRYEKSVPDLAKLLDSTDASVAEAAATALGKIGGAEAAETLQKTHSNASEHLAAQIDDALLACADRFLADGKGSQAAELYRGLYAPSQSRPLRIAALRGLASVPNEDSLRLLVQAIQGPDRELAASAIGFSRFAEGSGVTRALADLAPGLPVESQELLINALGVRGDPASRPAIVAATSSDNQLVRVAALEALGAIGDGTVVELLVRAAAGAQANEAQVARTSLVRLNATEVDRVLVKVAGAGETKARIEAIRALAKRKSADAVGPLLTLATEDNAAVREAAIRALGDLATESDLPSVVALLVKPKEAGDRSAFEAALEAAFRRIPAPEKQAEPLLAALSSGPVDAKPAVLRLLGRTATLGALEAVRAGLKADDASVREAAIRTLAGWSDATPADELLALARSLTEPAQKLIALRGYVRMAGLSKDPAGMYARAMELAQRPEDKRLVLSGLGTTSSPEALLLVEHCLADEALQAEAGLAATQIADRLRHRDEARARQALKRVLGATKDARVRQQAGELLNEVDRFQDHILAWLGAGPFKQQGKDAEALFAIAFPPEQPDAKDIQWKRITQGVGAWDINLDQALGSGDDLAGHARTRVWSPAAQDARLELGSDDGIKVWLNGKVVHANYTNRGCAPRQDVVKVRLQEGWNDLLLKIVNRGGGWAFACRIRQADGSAFGDLKAEAR